MNQSEFLVLGGGIVGVSTALALQARGHRVMLIDRQAPGLGASYGNAGVIQREAVEPYGFPRNPLTLMSAALGRENAIHYQLDALPGLMKPLSKYWANSAPDRYERIVASFSSLIAHSVSEHEPLIVAAGAQDLIRKEGWYQAYRSERHLSKAAHAAQRLRHTHGLGVQALSAGAFEQAAPTLKKGVFAGAIHWQDPWTVSSPHLLVQRYVELFVARGGLIGQGDASSLRQDRSGWCVDSQGAALSAANAVIALGAWSDAVLKRLGYQFPLFVKRGYHRHFATPEPLQVTMLDAENGIMLAPMKSGLRITTGAEFARLDAAPTCVQITRSEALAREIIELGDAVEADSWLGARPCTSDMKPVIGPAYLHKGLWFNLGHGHQGLTLGPAAARLLVEQIENEPTFVEKTPFLPGRFRK